MQFNGSVRWRTRPDGTDAPPDGFPARHPFANVGWYDGPRRDGRRLNLDHRSKHLYRQTWTGRQARRPFQREISAIANLRNPRVYTDVTGDFNTVVFVYDVDSMAEWEEAYKQYTSDSKFREKAQQYLEMWTSGRREFFRQV